MQSKMGDSVMVCGVLPKDAEFKFVGEKQSPLCKFGLKVGDKLTGGVKTAVWANCTCWRDVAYVAAEFVKGDVVLAIGQLQTRTYEGRDGEQKTATELVCEFVIRMPVPSGLNALSPATTAVNMADVQEVDEEELPFN